MAERIAVGAIAYGSVLAANAARDHVASSVRLGRSRQRLADARARLAAAKASLRQELARSR